MFNNSFLKVQSLNMIWKKYILIKLFISIGFFGIYATPQIPDKLVYKGNILAVYLYLPDEFYKSDTVSIDKIYYINNILIANLFGGKQTCTTTDCGRGYHATWKIIKKQLYLTGIYSCCYYEDSIKADLTSLFKEKVVGGKVKANWINSKNIVYDRKELSFLNHEIPVSIKEFEFEFLEGKLVNIKTFDNSKTRQSTYSQNNGTLLNFIYTTIDWDNLPKQNDPIDVIVAFSANEDGKIDEVVIKQRSDNEIFNEEAVRVIKLIPDWDVIYIQGKHFRTQWIIPIEFSEKKRKEYEK